MDRQEISFTLGKRLKELREERGLSHVDLIKQLNERYGVAISRDSVMAYEISDETRAKASKLPNMGMRVEYLYCFSDFYEVSLDYLLGITEEKSINGDLAQTCRYTGLAASSIDKLHELSTSPADHPKALLHVIDKILNERPDDFITWVWRGSMASCCTKVSMTKAEFATIRHNADARLVEAANEGTAKTVELPIDEYGNICTSTAVGIIKDSAKKALFEFQKAFIKAFEKEKSNQ